jgi:hypothetical protein
MDVWCVCAFFWVCVVLCLGRGLATSWSPVQGVLPSVKWSRNWEISPMLQSGEQEEERKGLDCSCLNLSHSADFKHRNTNSNFAQSPWC